MDVDAGHGCEHWEVDGKNKIKRVTGTDTGTDTGTGTGTFGGIWGQIPGSFWVGNDTPIHDTRYILVRSSLL